MNYNVGDKCLSIWRHFIITTRKRSNTRKREGANKMPNEPTNTQQQTDPQQGQQVSNGASTYTPPATQEALNSIIESRLQRERAKYADYEHLKEEAGKVDGLVAERDSLKSKIEELEKENGVFKEQEQRRVWAEEVAKEYGVPTEALRGETKEEMTAHAEILKKYVNSSSLVVAGDGKTPGKQVTTSNSEKFSNLIKEMI